MKGPRPVPAIQVLVMFRAELRVEKGRRRRHSRGLRALVQFVAEVRLRVTVSMYEVAFWKP